jgi:cyclic dehypoxanthinyl futalosine synthase
MVKLTGKSLEWVLQQLIDAGMSSLPGGGAEVLHEDSRHKISTKKVDTLSWLHVMEVAHRMGLKTSATLMFGMVEKDWHIIDHCLKIRDLQDKTQGFTAFIAWTFQRQNTKLAKLPRDEVTAHEYLRTQAIARIIIDNVKNIQSSWITQGLKLGQTALAFGANDIGGLLLEENVVTAAGVNACTQTVQDMVKVIHNMGHDAAQRDTQYNILKRYPKA